MNQTKTPLELLRIALTGNYNDETVRASAILQIIKNAPPSERLNLLVFLVTNFDFFLEDANADISQTPGESVDKKLFYDFAARLNPAVSDFILNQLKQNPTVSDFANNLWTFLSRYSGKVQTVAFCLLMVSGLPYAHLDEALWSVATSEEAQVLARSKAVSQLAVVHRLAQDPTLMRPVIPALTTLLRRAKTRAELEVILEEFFITLIRRVRQETQSEEVEFVVSPDPKNGAS